jgi:hypothetical protein
MILRISERVKESGGFSGSRMMGLRFFFVSMALSAQELIGLTSSYHGGDTIAMFEAELNRDRSQLSPEEAADRIVRYLAERESIREMGWILRFDGGITGSAAVQERESRRFATLMIRYPGEPEPIAPLLVGRTQACRLDRPDRT